MSVPYPPWGLGIAQGTPHHPSNALSSESVHLEIRQQPKEALLTAEGKEKARKPVDPPPIIQLKVDGQADPPQHFLQSPYLFMCVSLWDSRKEQPVSQEGKPVLAGSLVSSLHRLKDVDNRDGGFFVFGDVSVKVQGTHRLHFSLFDLHKDTLEVVFLKAVTSEPFKVVLPKDFKGMDESTYLSRAFSDQGVRLRLRKEPRAMMGSGTKRPYAYGPPDPISSDTGAHQDDDHPPSKRQRTYDDSDNGDGGRAWDNRPQYSDRQVSNNPSNYQPPPLPTSQAATHAPGYPPLSGPPMMAYPQPSYAPLVSSRADFMRAVTTTSYPSENLSTTLGGIPRYTDLQSPYQSYATSYSNVMRPSLTTTFRDDLTDDRYRTGAGQAPSGYPQTPTHSSHDSLGSSRGPTYSQSPEVSRTSYPHGSNSFSLPNLSTTQTGTAGHAFYFPTPVVSSRE